MQRHLFMAAHRICSTIVVPVYRRQCQLVGCFVQARFTIGALPADVAVPPTPFRPDSGVTPGAWNAEAPSKYRSPELRVGSAALY